jgi:signal transduction histidine kinase
MAEETNVQTINQSKMHQITESKNERRCFLTQYSNNSSVFSQTDPFCMLENLINDRFDGQFSKRDHVDKKGSDLLKNFVGDIIFELKTTLTNISLASELLETGLLSAEQKMLTDVILRNIKRLSDLTTSLNLAPLHSNLQTEVLKFQSE